DVDAFESATGCTFPDNHILSHDLIESTFARCGLVTDIEVFDDFPARYHAYARREHRWVRGDWQILPWLLPHPPSPPLRGRGAGGEGEEATPSPQPLSPEGRGASARRPNALPALERWKVFDNLRRS